MTSPTSNLLHFCQSQGHPIIWEFTKFWSEFHNSNIKRYSSRRTEQRDSRRSAAGSTPRRRISSPRDPWARPSRRPTEPVAPSPRDRSGHASEARNVHPPSDPSKSVRSRETLVSRPGCRRLGGTAVGTLPRSRPRWSDTCTAERKRSHLNKNWLSTIVRKKSSKVLPSVKTI